LRVLSSARFQSLTTRKPHSATLDPARPTTIASPAMSVLSNVRREMFANLVARGKSKAEAYTLAGYAKSQSNPATLAADPDVAQRIAEIRGLAAARAQVSADRVLAELARLGFSDITDAVKIERGKVLVNDTNDMPADLRAAISEISEGRDGVKVKFHDKVAALDKLGKHLGLWKDGAGDVNLTVQLVDLVNGSYKLEAGELANPLPQTLPEPEPGSETPGKSEA